MKKQVPILMENTVESKFRLLELQKLNNAPQHDNFPEKIECEDLNVEKQSKIFVKSMS